ncbi:MAG: M20/M25/M40 family metallo-hydrolase [Bacteroides sp.]|jgi:hypothetical protein|nr:M20/M25/M40 family metallo-hydrolase [Bacteroides sp.]
MQKLIITLFILIFGTLSARSQQVVVESIFLEALSSNIAYENLQILCETTEGRIAGSQASLAAVDLTQRMMEGLELDSVYRQEIMVPHWIRGEVELSRMESRLLGSQALTVSSLGLSVGTGPDGVKARVTEVKGLDELESLGREGIEGRIIFFNRPFNHAFYNTFLGYGDAVDQRFYGPHRAAQYGAVAVIVRSVTSAIHDFAHTGVTYVSEEGPNIPAVAVSTLGAEQLSQWLEADPELELYLETHCRQLPDTVSYNVIGEIRGSHYPNEIITVGGHLDAWDNSPGAHDDGAGCMQSMEVLRIFRALGLQPKRTVRAVMFMDEEIAQRGGQAYVEDARVNGEEHYFALEADRGAFSPRGFSIDAAPENLLAIQALQPLFAPYGMHEFIAGGSGVDIEPLKKHFQMTLAGLLTDSQRYFDVHHSANDTFDKINRREMQLGSAAMAALIYLLDAGDVLK